MRTGLLVVLLVSVIPLLNVPGLIVFLIAAVVRAPTPDASALLTSEPNPEIHPEP